MSLPEKSITHLGVTFYQVGSQWVTEQEFEDEGWHPVYVKGIPQPYWVVDLTKIREVDRRYSSEKQTRIRNARDRRAEEEAYTEYVNALDDAKPGGRG
jgi:hypothetical protein